MGTAWIAIVGTVIGAATSFFFQRPTLDERGETVRHRLDEFLAAASAQALGHAPQRRRRVRDI
ncbi:hypothetical protein [Kribbella flavida]|uniref:hypothetical protein n=1 Tax=Kribbella flavida TaxID=182640 RepID=UPI0011D20378|nr:hypothetical protein [Kribbella flavida]